MDNDEICKNCETELYMGYIVVDISDIVSSMTSNMKPYKSNKSHKYCSEYCALEYCEKVAKMRMDRKYMKMIKERKVDY